MHRGYGSQLRVRYIGGPTAVLDVAGMRIITDPTFDSPGSYEVAPGRRLTKLVGPALEYAQLGQIDLALLSHDQHADNFDAAGRRFALDLPLILTTVAAANRLGGSACGLENWSRRSVATPAEGTLSITGVPAQHGPDGTEAVTGSVTGFVISGPTIPTVYISGDNASLRVVREISERIGRIDVALLFAGAAKSGLIPGELLTLSSKGAAAAATILGVRLAFMLHFEGWAHLTEGREEIVSAFEDAGISGVLRIPEAGVALDVARALSGASP